MIDIGQASRGLAPLALAKHLAAKGGATHKERAWIAASEADAQANLCREYACEEALERARKFASSMESDQDQYYTLFDYSWLNGYEGTCYAHLGHKQYPDKAQSVLKQGLASLDPSCTFRQSVFYKDLAIASSYNKNVDEACHFARLAMNIAEQTNAPMELQRVRDATHRFLEPWEETLVVKNLHEEFHTVQQKLMLG